MPCDSRIQIELRLDAARIEVLDAALRGLGFEPTATVGVWYDRLAGTEVRLVGNDLQITGARWQAQDLKGQIMRATSAEVVKKAAARNGWKLSWAPGATKATATKMTYGR